MTPNPPTNTIGRSFARATVPMLPWLAGFLVACVVFIGGGMKLGLVASFGIIVCFVILMRPLWGVVAMIITGVSIPFLAATNTTGLPVSITQIIALFTVGAWLYWSMTERVHPTYSPALGALLLFVASVLLSVVVQPHFGHSIQGASLYIRAFVFALVVASFGVNRRLLEVLVFTCIGAMLVSSFLAASEYAIGYEIPSIDTQRTHQTGAISSTFSPDDATPVKRVSGGTGNYNWMAYTVAITLPLHLWWWRRSRSTAAKALIALVTLVALLALTLTYTRSGFIGLAAATAYLVYKRRIALWIPVAVIAAAVVTAPVWVPDRFVERVFSVSYLKKGTTTIRLEFIEQGIKMIKERPLLGYGYAQFGPNFLTNSKSPVVDQMRDEILKGGGTENDIRAHNMYVELAVDYGLLGLSLFLLFLGVLARDLREVEQRGNEDEALLAVTLKAAFVAFVVCGVFGNINVMKLPWVLLGVAAALRRVALSNPLQQAPSNPGK